MRSAPRPPRSPEPAATPSRSRGRSTRRSRPVERAGRALVEGTRWARTTRALEADEPRPKLATLVLCGEADGLTEAAQRAGDGREWTNRARDLVNSPPNETTPSGSRSARRSSRRRSSTSPPRRSDPDEISAQRMGAFAAVAQGSDNPGAPGGAALRPARAPRPPTSCSGLVGKAITFDTGGISLKPALHMEDMKGDMAGRRGRDRGDRRDRRARPARARAHRRRATENMPSGHAYRPATSSPAANGKTIEVTNTDAEGRLVLADALWYAREQGRRTCSTLARSPARWKSRSATSTPGFSPTTRPGADEILAAGERAATTSGPSRCIPRYAR
jgi:leucyl aminopeptidase